MSLKLKVHVVGTTFCNPNVVLKLEDPDCNLQLVPEPTNPHDSHAIKVMVDGEKAGYLAKEDARHLARLSAKKNLPGWWVEQVDVVTRNGNAGYWLTVLLEEA